MKFIGRSSYVNEISARHGRPTFETIGFTFKENEVPVYATTGRYDFGTSGLIYFSSEVPIKEGDTLYDIADKPYRVTYVGEPIDKGADFPVIPAKLSPFPL